MIPHGAKIPVELENIQRELEQSAKPLKAAEIAKKIGQKNGKTIKPLLDAEVTAGRLYAWSKTEYWNRSPMALARERLLQLTAGDLLAKGALDKRGAAGPPKISTTVVKKVHAELVAEGLLRELAGLTGKTKVVVNTREPGVYLEPMIAKQLAEFGIERSSAQIRALLARDQAPPRARPEPDIREVAEKMFAAINRMALAPGTTVTFYRLHQQPELAHVPKLIFDGSALLLQQERRALLSVHDHAARLPQAEQDELVTDGLGNYYVSIYAI